MPLKMHEIRELIRLVDESDIEEFKLDNDGTKIVMKKTGKERPTVPAPVEQKVVPEPAPAPVSTPATPVPAPAVTEKEDESGLHSIVSPMVGTFYRAPSPDSPSYVDTGDQVEEKSIVCIVEAMKLMNEIEAEVRGEIKKVLVENGQLVEYGQPLFLVKPE